jgi:hypothetical protein
MDDQSTFLKCHSSRIEAAQALLGMARRQLSTAREHIVKARNRIYYRRRMYIPTIIEPSFMSPAILLQLGLHRWPDALRMGGQNSTFRAIGTVPARSQGNGHLQHHRTPLQGLHLRIAQDRQCRVMRPEEPLYIQFK